MIRVVKDSVDRFLLVTVPAPGGEYQVLYMEVPGIGQIQRVADNWKWKDGKFCPKWEAFEGGRRTTREKLPTKWSVPIRIDEISLSEVEKFCQAVRDLRYSTRMLEDLELRRASFLRIG